MKKFELNNTQREYFGLDSIKPNWEKILFKGDTYRPDSILYFEGETIKRHIVSTDQKYYEYQYNELTKERNILLPKTSKGKEKKLTASVLEQRQPNGVYLNINNNGSILIGNYSTETTFYSSYWEKDNFIEEKNIKDLVEEFISQSSPNHLNEINLFKAAKRINVRFKSGDYFVFKLNRTQFGFGRILLDINKLRKKELVPKNHGLNLIMGPPILVQIFPFTSPHKSVEISQLENLPKLPSDIMMDNVLLYGEYEIIGHRELTEDDFEFPISYGRSIDQRPVVFLQWGLIHRELPNIIFNKFISGENPFVLEDSYSRKIQNPFGFYSIGFRHHYNSNDILKAIKNNGKFDYNECRNFRTIFDLRNPQNREVRDEILKAFGLDPNKSYIDNCKLTGTELTTELIRRL